MVGVVDRLAPHLTTEPEALAAARRCIAWLGRLMAATGQEQRAHEARDALAALDGVGT
jgi:hypothetical protein